MRTLTPRIEIVEYYDILHDCYCVGFKVRWFQMDPEDPTQYKSSSSYCEIGKYKNKAEWDAVKDIEFKYPPLDFVEVPE